MSSMKKKLTNIFIIYLILQNIIFNIINFPNFFNYWDEIIVLILIILGLKHIFYEKKKISKKSFRIISALTIVTVIGILGNLFFGYMNSINAIIRDIVGFIKFPLILTIVKELHIDEKLVQAHNKKFNNIIKIIIIILFTFGLLSLFVDIGLSQNEIRYGIKPYQFLFSHPTFLVLSTIFLLSIIESIQYNNPKELYIYEIMLLIIVILTLRTKGIAIVGIFIFIKYILPKIKNIKQLFNFKNNNKNIVLIFVGIIIMITSIYFVYDKISLYLSFPSSPREELYRGSFLLATKCFPLGSGFGTFASHISGKYNSKVYEFIKISYYWTENGLETSVLGDAGITYYIGQFGFIGIIILLYILFKLYQLTTRKLNNKLPVILLWIYIIVTLTSESVLINNGLEIAIFLAYISAINRKTIKQNKSQTFNEVLK